MKLIHKIILCFISALLLTLIAGYYSINVSKKALEKSIGENSVLFAQETLDKIDRDIYYRIEAVLAYSADTLLHKFVSQSNQEFNALENPQAYIDKQDKKWKAAPIETVTPFMYKLIDNDLSEELKEKAEYYEENYGYKVYAEIFVTNQYGANVAQTGKTSDYYQADENWWQKAKKDGLSIYDVGYDMSSGVYSIDIGVRIDDEKGDFLGVIKAVLTIKGITNILNNMLPERKKSLEAHRTHGHENHDSMQLELLNKKGELIYATKKDKHELFEAIPEYIFSIIKDNNNAGYFIGSRDHQAEEETLFSYAHSKGFKEFKGFGWVLLKEYNADEIFQPITNLKNYIFLIFLATSVVGILISLIISHSITKSIKKLRDASRQLGKGKLDIRVDVDSKDEIGQLANTFNHMTGDLKKITVSRDELMKEIAERAKVEEELKQSHKAILQQEKMASIGQLAAGVAHEINNPTGFISSNLGTLDKYVSRFKEFIKEQNKALESIEGNGFMEALAEKREKLKIDHISDDVDNLIHDCMDGTDRIKGIVNGLKGFARVDETTRKSIDINQCLDSTLNIVWNELKYKCSLNKDYGTLPLTIGYPQQLSQVFLNLLMNASQAIEKQGEINIKTCNDNGSIYVSISDNGCGIPDDKIIKIFDPFFTTKPSGKGTGLGLSISYDIVKKHGGEISVASEVGKGTTFNLEFPVEESADV